MNSASSCTSWIRTIDAKISITLQGMTNVLCSSCHLNVTLFIDRLKSLKSLNHPAQNKDQYRLDLLLSSFFIWTVTCTYKGTRLSIMWLMWELLFRSVLGLVHTKPEDF